MEIRKFEFVQLVMEEMMFSMIQSANVGIGIVGKEGKLRNKVDKYLQS